eukprot:gnl/TRDRNA2_/TRDRNA2_4253_c0_seq1.p1 gnl/TRDRNA2_/TRDRNA2_4253_c0~~gnl/TRDRNA2_/TRDRNA2_4253_c0_seq1.p1  ORF type:complete len:110 (+),score=15.72 gnl/TRDRNA2_/TRDRNA2_4253_c0_seq1:124-453(+)
MLHTPAVANAHVTRASSVGLYAAACCFAMLANTPKNYLSHYTLLWLSWRHPSHSPAVAKAHTALAKFWELNSAARRLVSSTKAANSLPEWEKATDAKAHAMLASPCGSN